MSPPVSEFYDDDDRLVAAGEKFLEHKVWIEESVKRNGGGQFSKSAGGIPVTSPLFDNMKIGDLATLKIGNLATISRSDGSKLIDSGWGFIKQFNSVTAKLASLDRSITAKGRAWLKSIPAPPGQT